MLSKFKSILIIALISVNPALTLAQTSKTILPQSSETSNIGCTVIIKEYQKIYNFGSEAGANGAGASTESISKLNETSSGSIARFYAALEVYNEEETTLLTQDDILGCAIITGRIQFAYLNVFLFYVLNWLSIASGAVAMFFIILGGYKYIIGGLTEAQDEGKKTIINAIIGLLVSTGAWIIVSIIQSFISR